MSFSTPIDYTRLSRFSGSGLRSNNLYLQDGGTTGTTSPGYFVNASGDSLYWHNDVLDDAQSYESHFLISFAKPSLPPTGDIRVFVNAKTTDQTSGSAPTFNKLTLWYLKELNPSLSQDYLVASGIGTLNLAYQSDWHYSSETLQSEPYTNYVPGVNGYLSLSGAWNNFGPDNSGVSLIDDLYLEIDGGAVAVENTFTCNLINSTLYTKTYTPNLHSENRLIGSGLNQLGQQLQFLSGSNLTEPIKLGVISSNTDLGYWTNDTTFEEFLQFDDFDIAFNLIDIIPTGKLCFNYRYFVPGGYSAVDITSIQLWAKKNYNPSLSGDILIGEKTTTTNLGNDGSWLNANILININEGGRSTWQPLIPNLYISVSGHLQHFAEATNYYFSGMELMVSGLPVPPTGVTNSLDLYTYGQAPSSGNIDLIAWCEPPSGLFPMTLTGHIANSGSFNMFLGSAFFGSGNLDMYTYGREDSTKSIFLTMVAPPLASGTGGPDMIISGPSFLPYTGILPMVVYYDTSPLKSFDMFLQNNNVASTGMISMFLQAPSGTYGAVPWSGVLPLYIARSSEGIDGGISMYISGPDSLSASGLDMYIDGCTSSTGSFDMSLSGIGTNNQNLNIFLHGF